MDKYKNAPEDVMPEQTSSLVLPRQTTAILNLVVPQHGEIQ
jgi:hypothetical protein